MGNTILGPLYRLIRGRWGSGPGEVDDIKIDGMTNTLQTINYSHHKIHNGDTFEIRAVDEDLGDNDYLVIAFTTPAAPKRCHVFWRWNSKVAAHIDVISGPTLSGGAAAVIVNRNLSSTKTTAVTNATILNTDDGDSITGGTIEHHEYHFASKSTVGGYGRHEGEFILAANTTYAFRLTMDAATNAGWMVISWYEHTDNH